MWPTTKITQILKISLPIVQAPMAGGISTPALVAAVSNAGGMGSLALGYNTPDEMRKAIQEVRELTDKPFAVNLLVAEQHPVTPDQLERARKAVAECCKELNFKVSPVHAPYAQPFEEQMQVLLDEKIPVFSFTFGIPAEPWLKNFKANNTLLIGTATNLAEAKLLEEKGIDIVAAQGSEAGGHRGTFIGKAKDSLFDMSTLTKSLIYNIKIPILAAGGIMNAEGVVTALAAGAAGVQMGTAFLACPESGANPAFKELLMKTEFDDTSLTTAFSGKLARGIKNKFITRMQQHEQDILSYPIQNALTAGMRKAATSQSNTDFMSLWAGQHAYQTDGKPAGEFIQELNQQMSSLFTKKR
ncbi:MAG: nitronate monooxygenase [Pseudomonadota bacterium]